MNNVNILIDFIGTAYYTHIYYLYLWNNMDQMKGIADDIFLSTNRESLVSELANLPDVNSRIELLKEYVANSNISKSDFSDFPPDRQLRLLYIIQSLGVDLGLCDYYRIFFSKTQGKMHHICEATKDKARATCNGACRDCNQGFFDDTGVQIHEIAIESKRNRKWTSI